MKGSDRLPRWRRWRSSGPSGARAFIACGSACAVLASAAAATASSPQTSPEAAPQTSPKGGSTPAGCAWPIAGSVEALLQAETEAVLQARPGVFKHQTSNLSGGMRHGPGTATGPGPGPGKPDHVAVAAIYGVGRRLHVDVRINGQIARYRNGRRWPEHAPKGGAGIYALAAVQGECVRLRSGSVARVACLDTDATADARRR